MIPIDRRTFLLASGALALAACSNDADSGSSGGEQPFDLAIRYPRDITVPGEARLVYSLIEGQTIMPDGPDTLTGRIVRNEDNATVVESVTATKRRIDDDLVYWAFRPVLESPGIYTLYVEGAVPDGTAVGVYDPATIAVPTPGTPLPPVETPTTDDARGVATICTRAEGACPFHAITLTEALATGKPVAYLIGTPAHCEFGTCGPGLEFLIKAAERLGDQVVMVHAEVYTDDTATVPAPAMDAYSLGFEPVMFLADATGTVRVRLEGAWDQTELDEELDKLLA